MITDPEVVKREAARLDEEQWRFRQYVKQLCRWSDARLNRTAAEFGRQAVAMIDCRQCAACCRKCTVPITDEDEERLARRLSLPVLQMREVAGVIQNEDRRSLDAPCRLLNGRDCSVYDDRPAACRGYPYIDGPVRSRMWGIIDRASVCPIVFEQVERLKDATGFRRLYPRPGESGDP